MALSGIKSIGRSRLERFRSETGDVVVSLFQKDPQEKKIMSHEKITWKKQRHKIFPLREFASLGACALYLQKPKASGKRYSAQDKKQELETGDQPSY